MPGHRAVVRLYPRSDGQETAPSISYRRARDCVDCRGRHDRARRRDESRSDGDDRRRREPPRDQSLDLRRRVRDAGAARGSERATQPAGRQRHVALQLAGQRLQPRRRLVLRKHRRSERDAGESADTFIDQRARRRKRTGADRADARLGRQGSARIARSARAFRSRSTARRPATTGSGFPTPATAS